MRRYPVILNHHAEPLACELDGDYATVTLRTMWTGVLFAPPDLVKTVGHSTVQMKRSPYGGYSVVQAHIAGWDYADPEAKIPRLSYVKKSTYGPGEIPF